MPALGPLPSWTFSKRYPSPDRPLLMAGDRVIGVVEGRNIYAVDIYSGQEVQTADGAGFPYTANSNLQAGPVIADGAIFFVENKRLKALEVADGSPRPGWGEGPQVENVRSLAAFPGVVVAILSSWDGPPSVTAFRTDSGKPAWQKAPYQANIDTNGAIVCAADALFFVAAQNDSSGAAVTPGLVAINSDFGDVRFPKPSSAPPDPAWSLDQTQAPLIGANVVVCAGAGVYAFHRATGALAWGVTTHTGPQPAHWACALSDDRRWIAAVSSEGLLCVIETATGKVIDQLTLAQSGTPTIGGLSIYVVPEDHSTLQGVTYDPARGKLTPRAVVSLGSDLSRSVAPVLGNGSVFLTMSNGDLCAKPYASVEAACFDGQTCIRVTPDGSRFNFGTGEFTVEAWVRSSRGGEILSSYPGPGGAQSHGFRFNLSRQGEIRFASINGDGSSQDLARTRPSVATDGYWHHVAATRKNGSFCFYLDGLLMEPFTLHVRDGKKVHANGNALRADEKTPVLDTLVAAAPPELCDIAAAAGLTIGAHVADAQGVPYMHFQGLLREVRVWDLGLDAAAIKNRMLKILPPTVEHLRGNWHLDVNIVKDTGERTFRIHNDVEQHEYTAEFVGGRSVTTDLAMDDSAFPYLLHQRQLQWPYASSWIVRGEEGVKLGTEPAVSSDGVVCFATDNRLYGVNKSNGARLWSIAIAGACSEPVALGRAFYAVTEEFGLIYIPSQTGEHRLAEGFEKLSGLPLVAPATDGRLLAVAGTDCVWILDLVQSKAKPVAHPAGDHPDRLAVEGGVVYGVASGQLFAIHPDGSQSTSAVSSPIFCALGERVFSIRRGELVLTGRDLGKAKATAASIAGAHVTGLSADADANLLVVSTDQGELFGLSFASLGKKWSVPIPDGDAPNGQRKYLNAPLVDGRNVYCTSRSGAVAALDGRDGAFRGLFFVPNAVVTPPVEDAGVVYFGCADTGATEPLDGGLHTVIFGRTTALRLGAKVPAAPGTGYARVWHPKTGTHADKDVLYFRNRRQCCVEAWINSRTGGEIVSVCPSEDSGVGLRLWAEPAPDVDPRASRIHFRLTDQPANGAPWETLEAQAAVHQLLDGKWHHVAVSAEGADKVRIYLDGQSQEMAKPVTGHTPPAEVVSGFLAFLGADATRKDSTAADFFQGMIGEVRVWDTYLVASEISHRMHDKLRGNEPGLLAYWNFDTVAVHDASRRGYDGGLAGDGAAFWLTDLSFEHPDYPYFTTKATGKAGDGNAHYTLTLRVHQANGAALAGENVQFWYLVHDDGGSRLLSPSNTGWKA
jgi:outer membrane protein assembly factor BamB